MTRPFATHRRPARPLARAAAAVVLFLAVLTGAPAASAAAGPYVPSDPGAAGVRGGWQQQQWNMLADTGVDAPGAWRHLIDAGRPGGRGVVVAVIDSGVAYRDGGGHRRSPGFRSSQFVRGHDFLDTDPYPDDLGGHGTHVAATIAERTGDGAGLTGLAYGVRIMPIRFIGADGMGGANDLARALRFAVRRGADVINVSAQFPLGVTARELPGVVGALAYAAREGVVVVAAAGNRGARRVPFPARSRNAIAVGATTARRCLAEYSNRGVDLDLVAPGGGADERLSHPGCDPSQAGPDVHQTTFARAGEPRSGFATTDGYRGTSMAAAHVSAAAALVIASGVLGEDPSPAAVRKRLLDTATDLGRPGRDGHYGAGLLNAAAATDPAR